MGFDLELLISLVKAQPVLWEKEAASLSSGYDNKQNLWKDIAEKIGVEPYVAQYKWKLLRTSFAREMRKFNNPKLNGPNRKYVSRWKFMKQMMFLSSHWPKLSRKAAGTPFSFDEPFYGIPELSQNSSEKSQDFLDCKPFERRNFLSVSAEIPARQNMNLDLLISSVKARPSLWNPKNDFYSELQLTTKLWKEVAEAVGVEEQVAYHKWLELTDTFRRELKRVNDSIRTRTNHKNLSKWKHMDDMMFLSEYLERYDAESLEPLFVTTETAQDFADESQEHLDSNPLEENPLLTPIKSNNETIEKPASSEDKLEQCPQKLEVKSDDYYFAMSIVPSMKALPYQRKLYIRTKIQQLLYNEHVKKEPQFSAGIFSN